jgi:flap endonuclease-1
MGIKGLTALISEHAPAAIKVLQFHSSRRAALIDHKEHDIKTLFGRKVAIDASMSIYQFLIAVRQQDGQLLTNDAGETTRSACGLLHWEYGLTMHTVISWVSFIARFVW